MLSDVPLDDPGPDATTGSIHLVLDRLVADHTLTPDQADAVLQGLAGDAASGQPPQPAQGVQPARPASTVAARVVEVGAYLGAGLVVAAGIVVVAQQWNDMAYGARFGVMAGTTIVLVVAALGLVTARGDRAWAEVENGDTLRRLSGTLFAFAAIAGFATVMVAFLSGDLPETDAEVGRTTVLGALFAFAILLIARWQANTPLVEIGIFVAVTTAYIGVIEVTDSDGTDVVWSLLALGLAWAVVATFTKLMRHPVLITALGLAEALFAAAVVSAFAVDFDADTNWAQRLALIVLVVVSLGVYLVRPSWPYITAGTLAAIILTVTWVGEAVGPAVALLAAGLVLLLLAGGALLLRRRRLEAMPTSVGAAI
ncbi:MAG: hypothetical protein ABI720_04710 [Actinomycetes bacterium]